MAERIQLRRTKGWRKPEGAIVVARPSRWGNPWRIGADGYVHGPGTYFSHDPAASNALAVALYADWLKLSHLAPALIDHPSGEMVLRRARILNDLYELRGHNLACWCPLDQPCHADVLLELANGS